MLAATGTALLLSSPALAMPGSAEELRATIAGQYGGNANAYAEAERGDFRRMGCKGRSDLLQVLVEAGLNSADVSQRTYEAAALCAFAQDDMRTTAMLLTPDFITAYELSHAGDSLSATLLWNAIYADSYDKVLYLLEHGVHTFNFNRYWEPLTREEHLLLAADSALRKSKEDAIRAFEAAGYGHILAAARNKDKVEYVSYRPKGGKPEGGGGGGLFRAIAGGLLGAAVGGTTGAAIGLLDGAGSGSDDEGPRGGTPESGPLPLATNRAELGLGVEAVTTPQRGLRVALVVEGGAGAAAGMRADDVITAIAGEPVASRGSLYVATGKAAKMPEYEVAFLRGGKAMTAMFGPPPPPSATPPAPPPETAQTGSPAPQVSGAVPSKLDRLEQLGDLRDRGIITTEEFEAMKAEILGAS